ncbi:hypothetical protein P7D22_04235 [Lichenihabitans sp. Uapishka_5]|uniref:hypothetical protein n=1 Tax=Lichenihabitans sp. Uapishka_5 TaxID=3037302 RepID=UPI0029E7EA98|nr:hypothetical protein [Lichenihabitans sp. Uapishka_5]MDX7950386.1 hypothetical protein [Lichenihabitans sp. Uapishka_5]
MTQPAQNKQGRSPGQTSHRMNPMLWWTGAVAIFTLLLVVTSAVSDWFIYQQYSTSISQQEDNRAQLKASVVFDGFIIVPQLQDGKAGDYALPQSFITMAEPAQINLSHGNQSIISMAVSLIAKIFSSRM